MKNDGKVARPFGLEFLEEMPETDATAVNGGKHHKKPKGPIKVGPGPYNSFGRDAKTGRTILDTV